MTSFHVTVLLLPMASFLCLFMICLTKVAQVETHFSLNKSSGGDALSLVLTWQGHIFFIEGDMSFFQQVISPARLMWNDDADVFFRFHFRSNK